MTSTPWQPLTLNAGCTVLTGGYVPEGRLNGDTVELRGSIVAAGRGAAVFVATLPAGLRPASTVFPTAGFNSVAYNSMPMEIDTGGHVCANNLLGNGTVYLDGVTFQAN